MQRVQRSVAVLAAGVVVMFSSAAVAAPRPMTVDDLFRFKKVAEPQISPDGKQVAYQVGSVVDPATNKSRTDIFVVPADGSGPPRQLTNSGKRDARPRWSPDSKTILFESNRGGTTQLYVIDLVGGGEARPVTTLSTGAGNAVWSPDGKSVAFVSAVYPEFSELPFAEADKKNREKDDALDASPVKAKTFTKLFYRHWDEYVGDRRQHLFVTNLDGTNCRNVTPGDRDAFPTSSTFSSGEDYCFSPDGTHLIFTAVPAKSESWSTNYDLCRVSVSNKSTTWETLTGDNPAADSGPRISGDRIYYRAQKKAGYEADKWDVLARRVKPDGTFDGPAENLTAKFDLSVSDFLPAADTLFFTADRNGTTPLLMVNNGKLTDVQANGSSSAMTAAQSGGRPGTVSLVFSHATMRNPAEVMVYSGVSVEAAATLNPNAGGGPDKPKPANLSHANDKLLADLNRPTPESVTVKIEDGEMQMWLLKPPGFDPAKKWPVVYLIHGGPQGAWEDSWSYRWNPQMWAAQGYVVVLPNPRGSTGFGQKFVDQISGDWGGKCYRDLVAGLEYVKKQPYVDASRMASAGASFGGYMQNWFAVNDIAKEFKCLITHCSVWNFESMWGTTDELWFDEYEHGGLPWEIPGKYREFSPHAKAGNLGKNKTPMLIIHNDLDFRCPIGQGHELFSALQRQGVPSRFVNFPDEGHWVLKPANSRRWHEEVFGWLTKHAPAGGK